MNVILKEVFNFEVQSFHVFFLCLVLVTACSSEKVNQVDNNAIVGDTDVKDADVQDATVAEINTNPTIAVTNKDDSQQKKEEERSSYSNTRFGFTIKYPSSWVTGDESENGDGKILYTGNDIDIRVYGSQHMEGITDIQQNEKLDKKNIKLENGNQAILLLGKENGNVIYDMVYVSSEDIEYHFYAAVTEEFFADNEKILLEVARSLDTSE